MIDKVVEHRGRIGLKKNQIYLDLAMCNLLILIVLKMLVL